MKFKPQQRFGDKTYSQNGEDLMIRNLFDLLGIEKPSYLDLGAHHPEDISNTKLLYDSGSRGVNVEANPHLIEEFKKQRPEDINLNVGISRRGGPTDFYMYDDHSGRNTCDSNEVLRYGKPIQKTITIETTTVNEIVNKYCSGVFPAFLSCDLEGLDYQIMESLDFSNSEPLVVCVEFRSRDHIGDYFSEEFSYRFQRHCRIGENLIFVKRSLKHLVY